LFTVLLLSIISLLLLFVVTTNVTKAVMKSKSPLQMQSIQQTPVQQTYNLSS
jgi:hypothetical protein